ncbi:lactose/L-arabinose transport system substrate-binding protein [Enterococcus sp. AZ194]|uniref:ABC transporter substrate-binding protein n=1 Tax=Enterococcus sp. AZ194 TaxID=2774629 RepID=UPI003F1F71E5
MKKFKKLVKAVVVFGALVGLTACGKSEESKSESSSDELTVWCWDANYNVNMVNKAVERYNKNEEENLKVNIQDISSEDVNQKMQTILSSGSTKGLPDIVLLQDADGQKFLSTYDGAFADMSDSVKLDDYYDFKKTAVSYEGKTYGLPFDTGVTGLFYRTDLFEEAGYSEKDLTDITWDQFMKMGDAVSKKTGVNYYADQFYTETRIEQILLQSANSWFNDESGKPMVKGNGTLAATLDIAKKLKASSNVTDVNGWDSYLKVTNNTETASIVNGCWFVDSIKQAEDQSGKWGLATIPRLDVEGATNYSNTGGASWFVMDSSGKKEEAIKFLVSTFGEDTEFQQQILTENGCISSAKEAAKGEAYQQEVEFFGNEKIYVKLTDWLNKIPAVYQTKETPTIKDTLKENLQTILDGTVPIDKGLDEIQASVESKIQ